MVRVYSCQCQLIGIHQIIVWCPHFWYLVNNVKLDWSTYMLCAGEEPIHETNQHIKHTAVRERASECEWRPKYTWKYQLVYKHMDNMRWPYAILFNPKMLLRLYFMYMCTYFVGWLGFYSLLLSFLLLLLVFHPKLLCYVYLSVCSREQCFVDCYCRQNH